MDDEFIKQNKTKLSVIMIRWMSDDENKKINKQPSKSNDFPLHSSWWQMCIVNYVEILSHR